MRRGTEKRRLTLHKETLRVLSGSELARAVGGTELGRYPTNKVEDDDFELDRANPKTNGWSGNPDASCA